MGKKKGTEKQLVHFNLYFSPFFKDSYTRIYDVLLETYNRTYDAIYKDVKENPEVAYKACLNKAEEDIFCRAVFNSEYDDGSEYYEQIQNNAVNLMQEQSLMHYQFVLMSLSNLYQVFEQQLRKWLFKEMTHHHNEYLNQIKFTLNNEEKDYGSFYSQFGALRNVIEEMKLTFTMPSPIASNLAEWAGWFDSEVEVPIVETEIWKTIRECNLLSNTFKHGSGPAAIALYKIRPEYFETVSDTKLMNLYRTTNMEEVLSVDKISFEKYVMAMKIFWGKLKERQSGSVLLEVDITSEEKEPTN
ncbi:hypothetical protein [Sporosarcina limicola]|uniref:Uncharacterized protein n=1 Tax=Sporosarcina limicola TaxID=34101 RepID=A0A927MGY1_9BACL|nr:hypothetical protein [Sporosarcina limicola]MBE1554494.1 hypothetical protein [Sporosarcina limicola]